MIAGLWEEGRGRTAKTFQINLKVFFSPLLLRFLFPRGSAGWRNGSFLQPPGSTQVLLTLNSWSRYQPRAALHRPPGHHIWPPNLAASSPGCWGSELLPVAAPARRQASAARCIISNLYRALKGIQRSNWEALKLKWGWDLESTLEPAVWREAWGSISSVLISREPNINVFWHFHSSSPGVYMRVGFLFWVVFFSFSFLCCCFFFTLKPVPSVILEEVCYHSVWGTSVLLAGLAAGPQRCPVPVTSLVTAALPGLKRLGLGGNIGGTCRYI